MAKKGQGRIKRKTKETNILVDLKLAGKGQGKIQTGISFLDHMLTLMAFHGGFDLNLCAAGDLEVGDHHTIEDVGICLGKAIRQALESQESISRYGHAIVPMDESLVLVAMDFSNRPYLGYAWKPKLPYVEKLEVGLFKEFFKALVNNMGIALHIRVLAGEDPHHIIEAMFKGLGRAVKMAGAPERKTLSTKGLF